MIKGKKSFTNFFKNEQFFSEKTFPENLALFENFEQIFMFEALHIGVIFILMVNVVVLFPKYSCPFFFLKFNP